MPLFFCCDVGSKITLRVNRRPNVSISKIDTRTVTTGPIYSIKPASSHTQIPLSAQRGLSGYTNLFSRGQGLPFGSRTMGRLTDFVSTLMFLVVTGTVALVLGPQSGTEKTKGYLPSWPDGVCIVSCCNVAGCPPLI
jgi:hypothetical protein